MGTKRKLKINNEVYITSVHYIGVARWKASVQGEKKREKIHWESFTAFAALLEQACRKRGEKKKKWRRISTLLNTRGPEGKRQGSSWCARLAKVGLGLPTDTLVGDPETRNLGGYMD